MSDRAVGLTSARRTGRATERPAIFAINRVEASYCLQRHLTNARSWYMICTQEPSPVQTVLLLPERKTTHVAVQIFAQWYVRRTADFACCCF